jgi:AcrR family transcriptional regulator
MAKRPIDRRAARTKAMLQRAHISLILEKGYEAITVEDICDEAMSVDRRSMPTTQTRMI